MLKVTGKYGEYQIGEESGHQTLNGIVKNLDLAKLRDGHMHILHEGKSYRVEIESADLVSKEFVIKVNGNSYALKAADDMDLLLEKLGMDKAASATIDDLKAPMPGLVIDVMVEAGQEVKAGDALIILEAMKMENVLKSPADLKVKEVVAQKGQTVDKNGVLIKF